MVGQLSDTGEMRPDPCLPMPGVEPAGVDQDDVVDVIAMRDGLREHVAPRRPERQVLRLFRRVGEQGLLEIDGVLVPLTAFLEVEAIALPDEATS